MLNTSLLSVLVHEQAKQYGEKTAMSYRDYEKNVWTPISWTAFSDTVTAPCAVVFENVGKLVGGV